MSARLSPFGLLVMALPDADPRDIAAAELRAAVLQHRVVVLRGFRVLDNEGFVSLCRGLGELLEWSFGIVNQLQARADAKNYLYTAREVPFHWDGAFTARVPSLIVFNCELAPAAGEGGETLFCDAAALLRRAGPGQLEAWSRVEIDYRTERVAHYGGHFRSPLLGHHPVTGEKVLRYAEPVEDLNPVTLEVSGADRRALVADFATRLRDPAVCLSHAWRDGDLLIADNHALLHGRRSFSNPARRHLLRINVL